MNGGRQVKEVFLSLETIGTWIVYVCHSEGEWARQKIKIQDGVVMSCEYIFSLHTLFLASTSTYFPAIRITQCGMDLLFSSSHQIPLARTTLASLLANITVPMQQQISLELAFAPG
jgi:hypothetical protein